MRIARLFAAALGGVLVANIVGCSGAQWGVLADTSQPTEPHDDSDSSHVSSPLAESEANQPVDLAETKHFKNRKGNAPLKADGFYDYNVAGFELFDICAELDGYDLAKHGLERFGNTATAGELLRGCGVVEATDGYPNVRAFIYSSATNLSERVNSGELAAASDNPIGLRVFEDISAAEDECMLLIPTPGGAIGVDAGGSYVAAKDDSVSLAWFVLETLLVDLLLGEK